MEFIFLLILVSVLKSKILKKRGKTNEI